MQCSDEFVGTIGRLLNDQPVTVPVHHHQVVLTMVGEVGSSDALEWVSNQAGWGAYSVVHLVVMVPCGLEEEQRACISVMAGVMPGQKNEDSAHEHTMVTVWWAECSDSRTRSRRDEG